MAKEIDTMMLYVRKDVPHVRNIWIKCVKNSVYVVVEEWQG